MKNYILYKSIPDRKSRVTSFLDEKSRDVLDMFNLPTELYILGHYSNNECTYIIDKCNHTTYPSNTLELYNISIFVDDIWYNIAPVLIEQEEYDGQEDSSYKSVKYQYCVTTNKLNTCWNVIEEPIIIDSVTNNHSGQGRNFYYDSENIRYIIRYNRPSQP